MLLYVPGRMPSRQIGAYGAPAATIPGYYGQQILVQQVVTPPSPPLSPEYQAGLIFPPTPPTQFSAAASTWPPPPPFTANFTMSGAIAGPEANYEQPQHQHQVNNGMIVVPGGAPPSPAHSDSDASNSSLEIGNNRVEEVAQLNCR